MNIDDISRFHGDSIETDLRSYLDGCKIKSRGDRRSRLSSGTKKSETKIMEVMLSECRLLMSSEISVRRFLAVFLHNVFLIMDLYSDELKSKGVYKERDDLRLQVDSLKKETILLKSSLKTKNEEIRRKNSLILSGSGFRSVGDLNLFPLSMDVISPCVYFLMRENSVAYIGQSVSIYGRVRGHISEGRINFDSVLYVPCEKEEMNSWEAALIKHFDPPYNRKKKFPNHKDMEASLSNIFSCYGNQALR